MFDYKRTAHISQGNNVMKDERINCHLSYVKWQIREGVSNTDKARRIILRPVPTTDLKYMDSLECNWLWE